MPRSAAVMTRVVAAVGYLWERAVLQIVTLNAQRQFNEYVALSHVDGMSAWEGEKARQQGKGGDG